MVYPGGASRSLLCFRLEGDSAIPCHGTFLSSSKSTLFAELMITKSNRKLHEAAAKAVQYDTDYGGSLEVTSHRDIAVISA